MGKIKNLKTLAAGMIIGVVLTIGATVFATEVILSATYNENTVIYNGVELELSSPLISIVNESTPQFASNYMPVKAVLEAMGYEVGWSEADRAISITSSEPEPTPEPAPSITTARGVRINGHDPFSPAHSEFSDVYIDFDTFIQAVEFMSWEDFDNFSITVNRETGYILFDVILDNIAIAEPVRIREALDSLSDIHGLTYDIIFTDDTREIILTMGDLTATIFLQPNWEDIALIVFGDNEAEIPLIITGGTSYVNESELINALEEVGFLD